MCGERHSPGHAGVGTVPDVGLQSALGHLHQGGVRGQLVEDRFCGKNIVDGLN